MARRGGLIARLRQWLGGGAAAPERPEGGPAEPDLVAARLDAARRRLKETIAPEGPAEDPPAGDP